MTCNTILDGLSAGTYDERLKTVYCCHGPALEDCRRRLAEAVDAYRRLFSKDADAPAAIFSGPGRTEIGGNHTDHQHGRVLAASVDLDMLAVAAPNGANTIRIHSQGYPALEVELSRLTPQPEEAGDSAALVRGIAAQMAEAGYPVAGFDAYVCSNVPAGSGLSSSAAYEVLMGVVMNHLFCGGAYDAVQLAQMGQRAENRFFGKPCGLMDQMASAVGGAVAIDFADPANPAVRRISVDLAAAGYALCIIDSGADHADLTEEYAAIPAEMGAVAAAMGKSVLRDVDPAGFYQAIPALRKRCGDRAVLRAMHFFQDDRRAAEEAAALEAGNFDGFLALLRASGLSSALRLENTYVAAAPCRQAVPLALALAEDALAGMGAVRVHGGGFAGTIQAFVPLDRLTDFRSKMEAVLGAGACHVVSIRPVGGCVLIGG